MKRTMFLMTLFCFCSSGWVHAQSNSFYIGGSAGLNLSKFKYTEDLSELYPNSNAVLGINGGFNAGLQLQNFTLSTGIHYVQKGGEYQTENFDDELGTGFFSAKERLHFLSIPILVGYRDELGANVGWSIAMGPSINIGLGGNLDETTEYFGTEERVEENFKLAFGSGVNEDYRSTQVGFQISPGLFVNLNHNSKVHFNVTWDIGLGDAFNSRYKNANDFFSANIGNLLNRSTFFSIGYEYHFSLGDRY